MKKALIPLLVMPFILPLSSCGDHGSFRYNYFIEGEFIAVNQKDENDTMHLTVKEITVDEYKKANKANVVFDICLKKVFAISLYHTKVNSEVKNYVTMTNIVGKVGHSDYEYEDDSGNRILPNLKTNEDYAFDKEKISVYSIYNWKSDEYYATFYCEPKESDKA